MAAVNGCVRTVTRSDEPIGRAVARPVCDSHPLMHLPIAARGSLAAAVRLNTHAED